MSSVYNKTVQLSVTLFVHCGDDYLFLLRAPDKKVDPNRLNGVGGRVEPNENYLEAAQRECLEETGFDLPENHFRFCGIVTLEGGYQQEWVMAFFKVEVSERTLPIGENTPDGRLMWLKGADVLDCNYELVDDLHYCFEDIRHNSFPFFIHAELDSSEKITSISKSKGREAQ